MSQWAKAHIIEHHPITEKALKRSIEPCLSAMVDWAVKQKTKSIVRTAKRSRTLRKALTQAGYLRILINRKHKHGLWTVQMTVSAFVVDPSIAGIRTLIGNIVQSMGYTLEKGHSEARVMRKQKVRAGFIITPRKPA